jgi:hypothetical protein
MYTDFLKAILYDTPVCGANLYHSKVTGKVLLYGVNAGTIVMAELLGLPEEEGFYGIQIKQDGPICRMPATGARLWCLYYIAAFTPWEVMGEQVTIWNMNEKSLLMQERLTKVDWCLD